MNPDAGESRPWRLEAGRYLRVWSCLRSQSLVILVASVCAGALWLWSGRLDRAPNVELTDLDGQSIHISEMRGQVLMVTFWATDCRTCLLEIPDLEALQHEFGDRGLTIVAVAAAYDMPRRVLELARARRLNYRVALDTRGTAAGAFGGIDAVPTTVLIGTDGRIRRRWQGILDRATLHDELLKLLGDA